MHQILNNAIVAALENNKGLPDNILRETTLLSIFSNNRRDIHQLIGDGEHIIPHILTSRNNEKTENSNNCSFFKLQYL